MTTARIRATDTRTAIEQSEEAGELVRIRRPVEPLLGIPAIMRASSQLPKAPALYFEQVEGYPDNQAVGCLFADLSRTLRLCGLPEDLPAAYAQVIHGFEHPIPPVEVSNAPCQERVITENIDLPSLLFPIHGALGVHHRYYQTVVVSRNPQTKRGNLAIYRSAIQGPDSVTINFRADQHGGLDLAAAKELNAPLPVALCIGPDPLAYLGGIAKVPYGYDELHFAGGVGGRPIEVVPAKTVDLMVPASAELVIEGMIEPPYPLGEDGPWPEYLGYLGMNIQPPIVRVTAVTMRERPINHCFVPGTRNLIGFVYEPLLLHHLRQMAGSFVVDVALPGATVGHAAVISVRKSEPEHETLQLNVALAAFTFAATIVDTVTIVDDDIDPHDQQRVGWAIATRCDPAKQMHILPQMRAHQNLPIAGVNDMEGEPIQRAKVIIDATIPWKYRIKEKAPGVTFFTQSQWPPVDLATVFDAEDYERWVASSSTDTSSIQRGFGY